MLNKTILHVHGEYLSYRNLVVPSDRGIPMTTIYLGATREALNAKVHP